MFSLSHKLKLHLNNNPLNCDCNFLNILNYIDLNLDFNDLTCTNDKIKLNIYKENINCEIMTIKLVLFTLILFLLCFVFGFLLVYLLFTYNKYFNYFKYIKLFFDKITHIIGIKN